MNKQEINKNSIKIPFCERVNCILFIMFSLVLFVIACNDCASSSSCAKTETKETGHEDNSRDLGDIQVVNDSLINLQ